MAKTETLCDFGERCEKRRQALSMTKKELGEALQELGGGGTGRSYNNWINGKHSISLSNLKDLCSVLKCDADYLLGRMDYRTHKAEWISEETGLSEAAADFLLSDAGDLYADILSELLTSKHTSEFLETFEQLAHAIDEPYPDLWDVEHSDGRRTYIQDAKELQHSGVKINQDILRRVLASKLENLLLKIGEGIEHKYWALKDGEWQEISKAGHYKTPTGIPSIVTEKEKEDVAFLSETQAPDPAPRVAPKSAPK